MMVYRFVGLLIVFATWLLPADADAAKRKKPIDSPSSDYQNKPIAAGVTVWYCAYEGNGQIACRLGDHGGVAASRVVQEIDSRLPSLVHDIRNNPDRLAGKRVFIPLHNDPIDFDMVGELAESVMCGSRKLCGIIFANTTVALERLVRTFENNQLAMEQARLAEAGDTTDDDSSVVGDHSLEESGWGIPGLRFAQAAR